MAAARKPLDLRRRLGEALRDAVVDLEELLLVARNAGGRTTGWRLADVEWRAFEVARARRRPAACYAARLR